MRINKMENETVDVTLSAGELVFISNLIFSYEHQDEDLDWNKRPLTEEEKDCASQIVLARDLCQYGVLDDFTLEQIVRKNSKLCEELSIKEK